MSMSSSPKRDKFFESRRFSGFNMDNLEAEVNLRSISNAEEIYCENEEDEEENFMN